MSGSVKRDLLAGLESIGEAHEFATFGEAQPTLPGLHVEGVGDIGLPVDPAVARALIDAAEMAPFGLGEETIVDPAVRSAWQIGPERLSFANKEWSAVIDGLVEAVATAFAIPSPIQHRLYKLLIYETGGHFAAHKDSEKEDGMFATLVVYLPSRNEGGRLTVRHAGKEHTFEPGGDGAGFGLHYAAFYTDCEHEIAPLTDGYRIALVYNLLLPSSSTARSAPEYSDESSLISKALWRLFEDEAFERVAITLDHEYSAAGLSPAALKGADRGRFDVLAGIAERKDYECSLALMTHRQTGEADYDTLGGSPWSGGQFGSGRYGGRRSGRWGSWSDEPDDDEEDGESDDSSGVQFAEIYEEDWGLEHWMAADGLPRGFARMDINPDEIIRDPDLELPYEQEVHGSTGNEGISVERWYRQAVVVLWPRSQRAEILAREGPAFAVPMLAEMVHVSDNPQQDEDCLRFAAAILVHWQQQGSYFYRSEGVAAQMLDCLVRIGDVGLGARFIREVMPSAKLAVMAPGLAALCERLGWSPCLEPIVEMIAAQAEPDGHPDVSSLAAIVTELCVGGSMSEDRLVVCRAAMEELERVVAILEERPDSVWRPGNSPSRHDVLAPVALALHSIGAREHFAPYVERALADLLRYDLRKILAPAAITIHGAGDAELAAAPSVRRLHEHVVEALLAATAEEPAEPSDWRQAVTLSHQCEDCLGLQAFANDPESQAHRFSVNKERRRHLHVQIDRTDHVEGRLDMTHVTERKGRPYTLVCTKTRAGHERAVRQYAADLGVLEGMGVGLDEGAVR